MLLLLVPFGFTGPNYNLPCNRGSLQLSPIRMASEEEPTKKGIDLSGLIQVISMGAGAPMLGDLKKTNFDKP